MDVDVVYVKAKGKTEINERLDRGETVFGISYLKYFRIEAPLARWPHGTPIKVYEKIDTYTKRPIVHYHYKWNAKKNHVE